MLTNTNLLETVTRLQTEGKTKKEILSECGYTTTKADGSIRYLFKDFYANLLIAKGIDINTDSPDDDDEDEEVEYEYTNEDVSKENMEKYNDLCSDHDQKAVDAFIECFSDDDLDRFEEVYQGHYNSEGSFVENFYEQIGTEIPNELVIDWEATWNYSFRYDFVYSDGYVFNSAW